VCSDCRNDGLHEQERMMAVRAIRLNSKEAFKGTDLTIDEQVVTTPKGSTKTVRGCRCKRSKCLKKYCECFGVGLKCGENCICEDCMNGNEMGGPSVLLKKKGALKKTKVHTPQAQQKVQTDYPQILHKPQFKPQQAEVMSDSQVTNVKQSTVVGDCEMPRMGIKPNPLQSRKPPLSVQIPYPAPQSFPVQRDIPTFDRNASTLDYPISALRSRETSTAWGMTPLGNAMELPLDRENSGFPLYSNTPTGGMKPSGFAGNNFASHTPTSAFPRELSVTFYQHASNLPTWQNLSGWGNDMTSARGDLRSPAFADSPKMGTATPRSPLQQLRPGVSAHGAHTQPAPQALQSPSSAIFSAAEGMLPSPVVKNMSGLGQEDFVMAREISARIF